jgi:hypothetical protein
MEILQQQLGREKHCLALVAMTVHGWTMFWTNSRLDGGGVRGLSSLVILSALMEVIQIEEISHNQQIKSSADSPLLESAPDTVKGSKYLPCHYFDFICGTSTGG